MIITDTHVYFTYGYLGNFHRCSITINLDKKGTDHTFSSSEQLFMYFKAKTFNDHEIAMEIARCNDPKIAKELGRKVKLFDNTTWDKVKHLIMETVLYAKFEQNPELKEKLLQTGNKILVEASAKDTIWGIGLSLSDKDIFEKDKWKGQNLLGKCLMKVREELLGRRNMLL